MSDRTIILLLVLGGTIMWVVGLMTVPTITIVGCAIAAVGVITLAWNAHTWTWNRRSERHIDDSEFSASTSWPSFQEQIVQRAPTQQIDEHELMALREECKKR